MIGAGVVQWLLLASVVLVVIALVSAWTGEVFGLNDRLDAADEEEEEDWRSHPEGVAHLFYREWEQERGFPPRIDDQRRD